MAATKRANWNIWQQKLWRPAVTPSFQLVEFSQTTLGKLPQLPHTLASNVFWCKNIRSIGKKLITKGLAIFY